MNHPQLFLHSHPQSDVDCTSLHVRTSSVQLWELVRDEDVHLLLREPAMIELARRNELEMLEFCKKLAVSGDFDEWLASIRALAALCTSEAVDLLVMLYARCYSEDRTIIIDVVGRILTAEHIHPFSIMIRQLAKPGKLDVTGWTSVAIGTLKNVCKRLGVEVVDAIGTGQDVSELEIPANQGPKQLLESEHQKEESLLRP
jgi:hypothetical protein